MSSNQNNFSSENPYNNVPSGDNPPTGGVNPSTHHQPSESQDATGFRQSQVPSNPTAEPSFSQQDQRPHPASLINTQVPTYEIDAGVVESPTSAKRDTGLDPFQDTSNQARTAGGVHESGHEEVEQGSYGGQHHDGPTGTGEHQSSSFGVKGEPYSHQQQHDRKETGDHAYAPGATSRGADNTVSGEAHQHHLGTGESPSTSANLHATTTAFTGIAPGPKSQDTENPASHTAGAPSEHYSQPGATPDNRTTSQKLKSVGGEVKSALAGIHGIGEKIRGEFNSGVDRAAGDQAGLSKNEEIRRKGEGEMYSGKFGHGTTGTGAETGTGERRTGI